MSSSAKAAATLKVHRDKMKNLEHGHAHLVWVPFSTTATTTLNLNSVWRQNKEATNWPCLLGRGAQCPSLPQHLQPSICNVYRAKIDKQGTYCTHRIVGLDALLCHGTHSPLFAHVYRAKIDQQDTCCTHRHLQPWTGPGCVPAWQAKQQSDSLKCADLLARRAQQQSDSLKMCKLACKASRTAERQPKAALTYLHGKHNSRATA
eukprot:1149367-Pelagomonas_calceolata.AAC.4